MKPTLQDIQIIFDLAHKYCPTAPCNIYTFMKEWQMCIYLNKVYAGADYQPSPTFNEKGIDLVDHNKLYPVVQVKSPRTKTYRLSGTDKMTKVAEDAMKVSKDALVMFDFQFHDQMYVGKASLLLEHNKTSISPRQAQALGFELITVD